MKSEVRLLRVVLKAIFLFVLLNVVYALVDPPVGRLTLYNSIIPGRTRFPYEEKPEFYSVGYSVPVNEDFDAMFGAHVISRRKPDAEFRLILLGDSATWGFGLPASEMLSEQINRLGIQTCDGRTVRAYNLAYPFSYLTRDLLILDKAIEYQPDMVLWLITLSTLEPKAAETQLSFLTGSAISDWPRPMTFICRIFRSPSRNHRSGNRRSSASANTSKALRLHRLLASCGRGPVSITIKVCAASLLFPARMLRMTCITWNGCRMNQQTCSILF